MVIKRLIPGLFIIIFLISLSSVVSAQVRLVQLLTSLNPSMAPKAAYGIRLLNSNYQGPILRVRQGTHLATADVAPDANGNISASSVVTIVTSGTSGYSVNQTMSLFTFMAGSNVFVSIWYDQSGNAKHVNQTTNSAQPQLILSGAINSSAGLSFNSASSQFLSLSGAVIPTQTVAKYILNAVWNTSTTSGIGVICEQNQTTVSNSRRASMLRVNGTYGFNGELNDAHTIANVAVNENIITSVVMDNGLSNNVTVYKNAGTGLSARTNGTTSLLNNIGNQVFSIGKKGSANSEYWQGNIAEVVIIDVAPGADTIRQLMVNQGNYFRVAITPPSAPTSLSVTTAGITTVSLGWNAPSNDGGGSLSDYIIEYRTGNGAWLTFIDGTSTSTTATITGLSPGTSYEFRVSAVNNVGSGSASPIASATTLNTCIISAGNVRYQAGQSITIAVTPANSFTGFVTLQYTGAGLSGTQTLNFNSVSAQTFTITPNTSGTLTLTPVAQSPEIAPPVSHYLTIGANNGLLDQVATSSVAAFGLRVLKNGYTGAVLRARFRTTNVKADVYADSSGKISTRSVAVISNSGSTAFAIGQSVLLEQLSPQDSTYIEIWYDQSGNNRPVVQYTNSRQPVLNMSASSTCIDFSNVSSVLQTTAPASFLNSPYSIATVVQAKRTAGAFSCWVGTNTNSNNAGLHFGWRNANTLTVAQFNNDANYTATYTQNVTQQYTAIKHGTGGSSLYQNGLLLGTSGSPSSNLNTSSVLNIGRGYDDFSPFGGYIFEMIFFNTALGNGERQTVECNQVSNLLPATIASISTKPINVCSLTSGGLGANSSVSTGFTGSWSKISGPGSITFSNVNSGNSTATVSQSGTYLLRWTINNASCAVITSDEVSITFNNNVSFALNTPTAHAAINNTVQLNVSNVVNANQYHIIWNANAINAGFTHSYNQILPASGNITIAIPGTVTPASAYSGTLFPSDSTTGCAGNGLNFTITPFYSFANTTFLLAGAYALRKLNNSYTGYAVQVKRSSDNTTQLIGFTANGDLDTAALKNFVGNGNGTITMWYDQSGRNKHVSATSGREPIIVSGGLIIRQNGRPALLFNGGQGLSIAEGILNGGQKTYTMNAVASTTGSAVASLVEQNGPVGTSNKRAAILQYNATDFGFNGELNDAAMKLPASPSNTFTTTFVCNHNNTTGNIQIFLNGKANLLTTNSPAALDVGTSVFVIGYKPSSTISEYWRGCIQEVIFSPEVISAANRIELQNSQSTYYLTPDSTQIIWTGSNSNSANTSANWSNTAVPSSSTNVFIPNSSTNPIVISNTLNVKSITIANNASVTISSSGVLKVAEAIISNGKPIVNNGTIEMNGSTPQLISGNAFDNTFKNLTINNTNGVTINGPLQLNGILTLTNGTLNTNGQLILKSSASSTASIAAIPATADIIGNVTFQRYIPSVVRRSRMLSSPVQNFTWQQLNDDIYISGTGGAANGFDVTPTNSSTCYTYEENPTLGRGWKAASSITQSIAPGKGTLVFIRGDRSLPAPQWYTPGQFPPQNEVILDFENSPINKGTINPGVTYTFTSSLSSDGVNLVGNPYPSAVSWDCLYSSSTNIGAYYYIYNPSTGSYEAKSSGNIPAGQSFFIQAIASNPIFQFTENCKVSEHNNAYFKTSNQPFTINIKKDSLNGDFVSFYFGSSYQRRFSFSEDALKVTNALINLYALADTIPAQINALPLLGNDTFAIYVDGPSGTYTLSAANFQQIPTGCHAWLIDKYMNAKLQLTPSASFQFIINNNQGSKGNRFLLVITNPGALPLKWLSFDGHLEESNIKLKWSTAQMYNCSHFEIERSLSDLKSFQTIGLIKVNNYQIAQNYTFTDVDIAQENATDIYYRIKQVDDDGNYTYSNTIRLITLDKEVKEIQIVPNPATAYQTIGIHIPQEYGTQHEVVISDIAANKIITFQVNDSAVFYNLAELKLKAGVYYVQITSNGISHYCKLVIK